VSRGWHGVDLDGTLAEYHGWKGMADIGKPIAPMVEQVRAWLKAGEEVRIVTARVGDHDWLSVGLPAVQDWCIGQFDRILTVTNVKDFGMIDLWDDRAVCVEHNTGRILGRNP
jgi:hypothetical protein